MPWCACGVHFPPPPRQTAREQLRGTMAAESAQLDLEAALGAPGVHQGAPSAPGPAGPGPSPSGASSGQDRGLENGVSDSERGGRAELGSGGGSAGSGQGYGVSGLEDAEGGEGGGAKERLNWDFQKKIDRSSAVAPGGAVGAGGLEGEAEEEQLLVRHVEGRAQALAALTAARQSVIVVAAFVGRVPNLAGLARTCEVSLGS